MYKDGQVKLDQAQKNTSLTILTDMAPIKPLLVGVLINKHRKNAWPFPVVWRLGDAINAPRLGRLGDAMSQIDFHLDSIRQKFLKIQSGKRVLIHHPDNISYQRNLCIQG